MKPISMPIDPLTLFCFFYLSNTHTTSNSRHWWSARPRRVRFQQQQLWRHGRRQQCVPRPTATVHPAHLTTATVRPRHSGTALVGIAIVSVDQTPCRHFSSRRWSPVQQKCSVQAGKFGAICFISIYGVGLGPWEFRSQNDLGESIDRIRERIAGPVQSCPEISQFVVSQGARYCRLASFCLVDAFWSGLPVRAVWAYQIIHADHISIKHNIHAHTHPTYAIECLFIYYVQITLYDHDPWTHSQLYTQFSH